MARKTTPQRRPGGPGPARFLLRLPATLHRVLSERARADGVSLNEYCVRRLRAAQPPLGFPIDVSALVDRVREVVADEQIVGLIVHGSMARGDASTSSDIDVLIVVNRDVALTRELYRRWDAGHAAPSERSVDAHFVHLPQSTERAGSSLVRSGDRGCGGDRSARQRLAHPAGSAAGHQRRQAGSPAGARPAVLDGSVMQNRDLAGDHVRRATARLRAVDALYREQSWADVVRESQEIVELALKGLLRAYGVDPPRIHDVADVLLAEAARLPEGLAADLHRLAEASRSLRRDRELAFYGAEDLTPSSFYKKTDATSARDAARFVVERVSTHVTA